MCDILRKSGKEADLMSRTCIKCRRNKQSTKGHLHIMQGKYKEVAASGAVVG